MSVYDDAIKSRSDSVILAFANADPSFDPPHVYTLATLRTLAPVNVHINLEYRNFRPFSAIVIPDSTHVSDNTWAVACGDGHKDAINVAREVSSHLKALQWELPTDTATQARHVQLLDDLHSAAMLEELHISEAILDRNKSFSELSTYAPRICDFISSLACLRRCRIEGYKLTSQFLTILPEFTLLQDLSIRCVRPRGFHLACDQQVGEGGDPQPTVDMPWLNLPDLRKLSLGYVCTHFAMDQLIPRGLTALRIEFIGGNKRLGVEDLDWLVRYCPGLERLELDMGSLIDFKLQLDTPEPSPIASSQLMSMFEKLRGFHRLHTLRLFPDYWRGPEYLSNPFANESGVSSAVQLFTLLRSTCSSLSTLIICIAPGLYLHDITHMMSLTKRPVKYVLRSLGARNVVLLHWGYGGSDKIHEVVYEGDTALPGLRTIPVSPKNFFDDLGSDWLLPHYETD